MQTLSLQALSENLSSRFNILLPIMNTPTYLSLMSSMLRLRRTPYPPSLWWRIGLSFVLILAFFFLPKYSFTPNTFHVSLGNILFPISHANIFHLAANILCIFLLKIRLRLPVTLAISFVCSLLPQWSIWGAEPILGFSGVLFAAIGIVYGKLGMGKAMVRKCLLPVFIFGLFPHVALTIHVYTLLLGYAYGCFLKQTTKP